MLRKALTFVAGAIAGPVVALLVLEVGCRSPDWHLGDMCGLHAFGGSLILLTLGTWVILLVAVGCVRIVRREF